MAASASPVFLAQLAAYRARTVDYLLQRLPTREPDAYLYAPIRRLMAHTGKGLRPALCLASCGAWGGDPSAALPSAAAIELLHNAFLVHDDIEDYSQTRHNQPTLYIEHGMPLALNAGDAMLAQSMSLLRANYDTVGPQLALNVFDEFDHMLARSLEGQALELGWVRNNVLDVTVNDYIRLVLQKTCWYSFIHPCRIGALIASGGKTDPDRFNAFGLFLGAAFQIRDDLLNLQGTDRYGKEIGGDLYEGKRTLMLVHLLENASLPEKERLRAIFAKPRHQRMTREVQWISELLSNRGSLAMADATARRFSAEAEKTFEDAYAGAPENEHKQFLRSLLAFIVQREL
jgi:geranylgeranyl diphosphate synthase type II